MNVEIKRIHGTLHRATQSACPQWAPVAPTVVEGAEAGNEGLTSEPTEETTAEPDISGV